MAEFVFASAYGGAVKSENPPQIHGLIKELRRRVTLDAKKAPGVMFPVKSAKELNQKLAEALDELDMVASPIAQEIAFFKTDEIPDNKNAKGTNPVFRTLAHVRTTVRFVAPDTSFLDVVGSGHGGDVDDKAGGKASTYSWKDAVLKGLTIPHEDMVDTDDDSSASDVQMSRIANKGGSSPVRLVSEPSESTPADFEKVKQEIAAANSVADLEVVRKAIKDGTLALHGPYRLKASVMFTKKMAELAPAGEGK